MSPAALATAMTLFTGSRRGKALGVWSALSGAGSALGVILGGVLTSEAGWRWVFAINVPIGVALLLAIPLAAPARQQPAAVARGLDIPGAALVTAGTGAAIYGLINVGSRGWSSACTAFVTAFTASLADAAPDEAGLRSALVSTFHELGGAVGVAVLSSAAGAGLVTAHISSHDFARAFTVGAVCAVASVAIAAALVPAVLRKPAGGAPMH